MLRFSRIAAALVLLTISLSAAEPKPTRDGAHSPEHAAGAFPAGAGNSTGHLGRWLTDSTGSSLGGRIPALEGMPLHNEDGTSSMHLYAPFSEVQAASARAV